jgi:sucrose-6-phosphate hydrolase SacC (GH32 family)
MKIEGNMKKTSHVIVLMGFLILLSCKQGQNKVKNSDSSLEFATEMVEFVPYEHNPLFSGTKSDTWDRQIRERGFIMFDEGIYKMWYTGYEGDNDPKALGYATSDDGISWTRFSHNPVFSQKWTEDMFVMKHEGKYFMFAEGMNDVAHLLTSDDGIAWQEQGDLIILTVKGDTISGPYGTPSVFIDNGKWHLFYERNDEAIWLATSGDLITWTNIQDEPVLNKGPETYDKGAVALNQVIEFKGKYYMFYHGSDDAEWATPGATSLWTSNVAVSDDLLHWVKYPGNPVVEGDHSSPVMVYDGKGYRLYTMHDEVCVYFPE